MDLFAEADEGASEMVWMEQSNNTRELLSTSAAAAWGGLTVNIIDTPVDVHFMRT